VVQWIDTQLSIIHDRSISGQGSSKYTDELAAEIKKFQVAEGLEPDGIVGSRTIIHLNTLNDQEVPLLIKQHTEEL
jgi:general secretion pathway protein A